VDDEFLIAMRYAGRHLNKATLSEEGWDYLADIIDRLEILSAHNRGMDLKAYRRHTNIFPYLRLRAKRKGFKFDENIDLLVNVPSVPREDA
jgi:hypothetical protein